MYRLLMAFLIPVLLASCGESSRELPPNILILVADDLGVDSIGVFGEHERNATTANLDSLAARGMRFDQFWSQPVCSSMRVTALTGRYTFRHGVGGPLWSQAAHLGVEQPQPPQGSPQELDFNPLGIVRPGVQLGPNTEDPAPGMAPKGPSTDEIMIPAILKQLPVPYATAAIGKWHMADRENGWLNHPNNVGFDFYSGVLAGDIKSFFAWQHVENGTPSQEFGYVDQHSVDTALNWIHKQDGTKPWFMWFSFINPHEPFHKPPVELIQSEELKNLDPNGIKIDNTPTYFKAQVEAMDSLVGQLLAGIPEEQRNNTYVIWLGDNGDDIWSRPVHERRPNRFKMTNYKGGTSVPLIVAGPNIPGNTVNSALTHVVDLFSTVIELAGGDPRLATSDRSIDSLSLREQLLARANATQRQWNYTDIDAGKITNGRASALRNADYKLISTSRGEELYHLRSDPDERNNLIEKMDPEAEKNYVALKQQLHRLLDKQ